VPGGGLTEAGSIVVLLALGVAISNADWRERVGEGGGETSWSSVAVSISSLVGRGRTTSSAAEERSRGGGRTLETGRKNAREGAEERSRGGGVGRESQSL